MKEQPMWVSVGRTFQEAWAWSAPGVFMAARRPGRLEQRKWGEGCERWGGGRACRAWQTVVKTFWLLLSMRCQAVRGYWEECCELVCVITGSFWLLCWQLGRLIRMLLQQAGWEMCVNQGSNGERCKMCWQKFWMYFEGRADADELDKGCVKSIQG